MSAATLTLQRNIIMGKTKKIIAMLVILSTFTIGISAQSYSYSDDDIAGIVQELIDSIGKQVPKDAIKSDDGLFTELIEGGYLGFLDFLDVKFQYIVKNGNTVDSAAFLVLSYYPNELLHIATMWSLRIKSLSGVREIETFLFLYKGYTIKLIISTVEVGILVFRQ
jgi:hypothetical protein